MIFEAYKKYFLLVFCNTYSLVFYRDRHTVQVLGKGHFDSFTVGGIFKGIRQQVVYYFFKLVGIYPQEDMFFIGLKNELHVVFFGQGLKIVHDATGVGHDVSLLHNHFHFFILNLPEVQNLVDQSQHAFGISVYHRQLFFYLL